MAELDGMICTQCGYRGPRTMAREGSLGLEIVLWLCLVVPGVLYTLWRLATLHRVCAKCQAREVIPVDTPRGRKLIAEYPESA